MVGFVFVSFLAAAPMVVAVVVPLPSGPYGVSIQDVVLTDYNVPDPFLNTTYRKVPISIIAPTGLVSECEPTVQRYMPKLTASVFEQGFSEAAGLPIHGQIQQTELILCKPKAMNYTTPVVIFSPAATITRYLYHVLGSAIAAHTGYTVITYDIPGQTVVEDFPDGAVENKSTLTSQPSFTVTDAVNNDAKDASIILDAIFLSEHPSYLGGKRINITSDIPLPEMLKRTTQASMIGHSQGGAAAIISLLQDPRLCSGVNFDGQMNEAAALYASSNNSNNTIKTTTIKPFAIFEHQGSNQTTAKSWPSVWANVLRGTKFQFQINGTQHGSFGDFPYLIDLYGLRSGSSADSSSSSNRSTVTTTAKAVDAAVGTVPGSIVIETIRDVLGEFLRYGFAFPSSRTVDAIERKSAMFGPWGFYVVNQTVV